MGTGFRTILLTGTVLTLGALAQAETLNSQLLSQPRIRVDSISVESGSPNRLTSLPDYICFIQDLRALKIGENQMPQLADCSNQLGKSLQLLQIENNPIDNLGILQNRFPALTTLILEGVPLSDGLTLAYSANINQIQVDNCNLGTGPINIHSNPNLESLTLADCGLDNTAVRSPGFLGGLSGLTFLSLRGNGLSEIPTGLPFLLSLRTLDLTGNAFTDQQKAAIRALFSNRDVTIAF